MITVIPLALMCATALLNYREGCLGRVFASKRGFGLRTLLYVSTIVAWLVMPVAAITYTNIVDVVMAICCVAMAASCLLLPRLSWTLGMTKYFGGAVEQIDRMR